MNDTINATYSDSTGRHVIIVHPDDVLLIGNLGVTTGVQGRRVREIITELKQLGIIAFAFPGPIDVDKVKGGGMVDDLTSTRPEGGPPDRFPPHDSSSHLPHATGDGAS